jgi:REP element-mobilizing transposase RayT
VNMNKSSSVETEEIKREQAEETGTPVIWVPAPAPEIKQEDAPRNPGKQTDSAAPQAVVPQLASDLSFACVLIPRFSDHYLVGDIVDWLPVWMKQVCISYGWRLDKIAVRPGYVQWVMYVPMNSNPAHFMRLIRRYTSDQIFEDFPRFKQKNISGEFWAPGNFVVPGSQLQSPEQVNEFILQTRRYQGM